MRSSAGRAWLLPDDFLVEASNLMNVWFGKDDAYVAQTCNGGVSWDLRGHYGSLGQTLQYWTRDVVFVRVNQTDARSYIVVFVNGEHRYNLEESRLTEDDLRDWISSFVCL